MQENADAAETTNAAARSEGPNEKYQAYVVGRVYDKIASLLPTEGRDYKVDMSFSYEGKTPSVSIRFRPYNEIGRIWCGYLTRKFGGKR